MVINVDSDGVVSNFVTSFMYHADIVRPQPTKWEMWEEFGITKDEFVELLHRMGFDVFAWAPMIKGARQAIDQLTAAHRVRVVTHKIFPQYPEYTRDAIMGTVEWYDRRNLLDKIELSFTSDYGKQGYVADIIIDDKPTLEWAQYNKLNILFDQPWNQNVDENTMYFKNVYRAYGWNEVLGIIEVHEEFNGK